ncbi:MAG TPA: SDR family oxidoreductase [Thermoguttaceae bacterium]|nr:SDR family oxidoreductase [Thermoguttaceae bacterium]
MNLRWDNKAAVVTGASSGLGRATAILLAEEGARVFLVARRADMLQEVADQIDAGGGQAVALPCDVTDDDAVKRLAAAVRETSPRVDLLVNSAGREQLSPLLATSMRRVRDVVELNLVSVVSLLKAFLPMLTQGSAIVNVSSCVALRGAPGSVVYAATKGALISLTRSLAREVAPRGIRVNAIAPGQFHTEMLHRVLNSLKPEQVAALEDCHPLGFGQPDQVAAAIAFLGSERASWITGQTLVVDGGMTA